MNALFALALLVSPSWAGVVMPVESGVAPAGPSMTAVPVLAPAGGTLGMPSLGGGLDLSGALPMLPAPVPGLVGPALKFVGDGPQAAAVHPETAATVVSPVRSPAKAAQAQAADKTPALPAKPSPGASALAISLDRKSAASTLENGSSSPLIEPSALEHAQPEKAAGLGRSFFDQSNEKRRGTLENTSASEPPSPVGAAGAAGKEVVFAVGEPREPGETAGTRDSAGTRAASRLAAFGAGHSPDQDALSDGTRGETLRDAVASMPGGAAPGGAAVFFRSAAPNGELPASAGAAGVPVLGAPHPLALDLSGAGLIVRVRAALNGAIAPAPAAAPAAKIAAPGPSTALLERGAMLEAFSVAGDYAERAASLSVSAGRPVTAGASRSPASVPAPESSPAPLWWAWFALPLFVAAVRGIL